VVSEIASIYLDEHISEGYVIVCGSSEGEHSFLLSRLGPSIECPKCGRTALSAALLDAYYKRPRPLTAVATSQACRSRGSLNGLTAGQNDR
jgi:hypothetical protein